MKQIHPNEAIHLARAWKSPLTREIFDRDWDSRKFGTAMAGPMVMAHTENPLKGINPTREPYIAWSDLRDRSIMAIWIIQLCVSPKVVSDHSLLKTRDEEIDSILSQELEANESLGTLSD